MHETSEGVVVFVIYACGAVQLLYGSLVAHNNFMKKYRQAQKEGRL